MALQYACNVTLISTSPLSSFTLLLQCFVYGLVWCYNKIGVYRKWSLGPLHCSAMAINNCNPHDVTTSPHCQVPGGGRGQVLGGGAWPGQAGEEHAGGFFCGHWQVQPKPCHHHRWGILQVSIFVFFELLTLLWKKSKQINKMLTSGCHKTFM